MARRSGKTTSPGLSNSGKEESTPTIPQADNQPDNVAALVNNLEETWKEEKKMGLFGEMSMNDVPTNLPRGTYQMILSVAEPVQDDNSTEPRESYRLSFEIDEDKHPDYWGMYPAAVFLATYPKMTQEKFDKLPKEVDSDKRKEGIVDQKTVRGSMKAVKILLEGMGIPPEDRGDYELTRLDGKKIVANCYPDKETGNPRVQAASIKKANGTKAEEVTSFDDLGTNLN